MSTRITISDELREKISKRDAAMPTLRELFAPVREQIEGAGTTDEELSAEMEGALSEVRA